MELQVGDKVKVTAGSYIETITITKVTQAKAIATHYEKVFHYPITTELKRHYDDEKSIKGYGRHSKYDIVKYELIKD